jgi:probable rRNA maturation factor
VIRPAPPTGPRKRRRADEGTLEVFVADEQAEREVDVARWEALARNVLEAEGVEGEAELAVIFVDEATIAQLNGTFMGQQGPTDVLAFPIDDDDVVEGGRSPDSLGPGAGVDFENTDPPNLLGDVVVCPAVAARNAPEHAGTYDDEMALLVVHGILHILGMDHVDNEEAEAMEARERELLEQFHKSS